MNTTGCIIVGPSGIFLNFKLPEINLPVIVLDCRLPAVHAPKNTLESRRTASTQRVHHVLGMSCSTQVFSAIVQAIAVLVIDLFRRFSHQIAVHQDCDTQSGRCLLFWRTMGCSVSSTEKAPIPARQIDEVRLVYLRKLALCERDESYARLWRRRNRNTNNSKSISIALRTALVAELSWSASSPLSLG